MIRAVLPRTRVAPAGPAPETIRPAEHHVPPARVGDVVLREARAPPGRAPRRARRRWLTHPPSPLRAPSPPHLAAGRGPAPGGCLRHGPPAPGAGLRRPSSGTTLAIPVAVFKKFGDDQARQPGGAGRVLRVLLAVPAAARVRHGARVRAQGDPSAQPSVEHSVLGQFPIIGSNSSARAPRSRRRAGGRARDLAAGRPRGHAGGAERVRPCLGGAAQGPAEFLQSRLRGLGCWSRSGSCSSSRPSPPASSAAGSAARCSRSSGSRSRCSLNFALFFAAFQLADGRPVPIRDLAPASSFAGVVWTILQSVGGFYIDHVLKKSSSTYGAFALVIALLRVAAPRRPDDPLRGRDQRRARPPPVAAQPVRAAGPAGRPAGAPRARQGRGALRRADRRRVRELKMPSWLRTAGRRTRGASPRAATSTDRPPPDSPPHSARWGSAAARTPVSARRRRAPPAPASSARAAPVEPGHRRRSGALEEHVARPRPRARRPAARRARRSAAGSRSRATVIAAGSRPSSRSLL